MSDPQASPRTAAQWRGDLTGGVTAAIIALPLSVAFGVATVAPLGAEHAPLGALAGLTAAVVGCFVAAAFGGTPAQITGPTGPMTVVLSSVVAMLVLEPPPVVPEAQVTAIITLTLLTAFLGGMVQISLGAMGVGGLVQFIPYPVIAGFMNGIAVIILLGQLPPLLGAAPGTALLDVLRHGEISVPVLLVAATTLATTVLAPRVLRWVPAALVGLISGTAAFYGLRALGLPMSAVVGSVPSAMPVPHQAVAFVGVLGDEVLLGQVPRIVGPALALGVLGSIDSLLTSVVADVVTADHHDSRRELIGQGLGNMASACFGGLAGAGTTVATLVNVNAGGRTRRAGMVHSATLLAVMLVAAPLAGAIPLVVLAGILVVTAVGMVDGWSRKLLAKAVGKGGTQGTWINLGLVLLVTIVTVSVDLMVAVAVGLALAGVVFVAKMGTRIVRRVHSGRERHAFKERTPQELAILERECGRIAVLELDGALFFGSSHRLIRQVEHLANTVDYLILDAHHVSEIDGSGARALQQIHDHLADQGKELLVSFVTEKSALWAFLGDMGDIEVLGEDHFFVDTDHALEWAEDHILQEQGAIGPQCRMPFEDMAVATHFTPEQRDVLRAYLEPVAFEAGSRLYEAGTVHHCLWVVTEGCLTVLVPTDHELLPDRRITTLGPGHVVGERGFFTQEAHTFSLEAATDVRALKLTREGFERMQAERPDVAMGLLYNLGRELSARIHTIGRTVAAMDG